MDNKDVIVYVSDNNLYCTKVVDLIQQFDVSYKVKNVTQNKDYMKEMQEYGIFGTPATFIKGNKKTILGFQREKLNKALTKVEKKEK